MNDLNYIALSSEEEKKNMRIEDLSFDFAKRIVILNKTLTLFAENKEYVISKQILKSGTSIGANISEAMHPQSDADYLSKMNIALKEANETKFWLRLLNECKYISSELAESLLSDCNRIIKTLITIVNKVSTRIKNSKSKS